MKYLANNKIQGIKIFRLLYNQYVNLRLIVSVSPNNGNCQLRLLELTASFCLF